MRRGHRGGGFKQVEGAAAAVKSTGLDVATADDVPYRKKKNRAAIEGLLGFRRDGLN